MVQTDSSEYYRGRELAERQAAKEAQCPQARRVHEEMANAYARLIEEPINPSEPDRPDPIA
jgi:hypothetical protein